MIVLIYSSNVQTVQKVISDPVKNPKTISYLINFPLFTRSLNPRFFDPFLYEKLAIENQLP
jgi:hypothetical protein